MTRRQRKLHIEIDPPVEVTVEDRRVRFDGLNLLTDKVMVEYVIDPPLGGETFPGPNLLILEATDDASDEPYETMWPDFVWRDLGPGRTTTRLERRPPPDATCLHFVVRPAEPPLPNGRRPETSRLAPVARFDVELPPEHGLPPPPRSATGVPGSD